VALVLVGLAIWFVRPLNMFKSDEVASKDRMELPLPAKPSIAVLPFTNMSSDPEQDHFVDGMTDDLITDLSKVSGLFVISRNSTFIYKDRAVKVPQVAEELGVRYVLEGSVQRAGDRLRVNAQLIDALTGGHVWADRFDGSTTDLFAAQDDFLSKIVAALKINLTGGERQEIANAKTDNLDAKAAFDEGWDLYLRYTAKDTSSAIELFKRATELDPEYGRAYAALTLAYIRSTDSLWAEKIGIGYPDLYYNGLKYLELAKRFPTSLSHTVEAIYKVYGGQPQAARQEAGRAIALDPNDPEAHIAMAWALTISGEPEEALNFIAKAMRLNPRYPSHYALARGIALLTMGDLTQAAEVLGNGLAQNPDASMLLVPYSSILAQLGRREEARQALLRFRPGIDQQGLENFADTYEFPVKWDAEHATVKERLFDGLRLAALPTAVTVQSLVDTLQSGNAFEQITAIKRLGWFGPTAEQAVPALIEALKNKTLEKDAIETLGKIGPIAKAAVPELLAVHDDALARAYAQDALMKIRGF
jgi:adenylate cyclase